MKEENNTSVLTREQQIFETYSVPKALSAMIIPTIISQIVLVIYNLADTWYVGLTGSANAVAAISLCLPIYNTMSGIGNLFGIGGASVIARALGVHDNERAKKTFCTAFYSSLISAVVYSLIIFFVNRPLLLLIGADEGNIDFSVTYSFVTIVCGGIPTILSATFAHLIRSTGKSKQASAGIMTGTVLNIILDPLFMFVLLPKGNELLGASLATAFSNLISLIYFIVFLIRNKNTGLYDVNIRKLKNSKRCISEIILCGLPAFGTVTMSMFSNCFLNPLLRNYGGGEAVAAIGIVRKIDLLAYAVVQGVTQGMLPLVAYCYSSKKYERMRKVILYSTVFAEFFALLSTTTSQLFAPQLISVFIRDTATITYGAEFLRVISLCIPLYVFSFVVIAVLEAVGESREPFIISILHKGSVDIILMLLINAFWNAKYVTWASPVMDMVTLLIAGFFLLKIIKKLK